MASAALFVDLDGETFTVTFNRGWRLVRESTIDRWRTPAERAKFLGHGVLAEHAADLAEVGDQAVAVDAQRQLERLTAFEPQAWIAPVPRLAHVRQVDRDVDARHRGQLPHEFGVLAQAEAPESLPAGHDVALRSGQIDGYDEAGHSATDGMPAVQWIAAEVVDQSSRYILLVGGQPLHLRPVNPGVRVDNAHDLRNPRARRRHSVTRAAVPSDVEMRGSVARCELLPIGVSAEHIQDDGDLILLDEVAEFGTHIPLWLGATGDAPSNSWSTSDDKA